MLTVEFGIRQGSVLSPYLSALYLGNLSGLYVNGCAIILYAGDRPLYMYC